MSWTVEQVCARLASSARAEGIDAVGAKALGAALRGGVQ
eukprot:gene4784-8738_t